MYLVLYLKSKKIEKELKKEFYEKYPKIDKKKKIILYCPTSRKNSELPLDEIVKSVDLEKYILILKLHNNTNKIYHSKNKFYSSIHFSGMQMLHIADYIITDYSAIVYEAAITKKPIYLYTFDYDKYIDENGAFDITKCNLISYANGKYFSLGKQLGKFGYSVGKKKKKSVKKYTK